MPVCQRSVARGVDQFGSPEFAVLWRFVWLFLLVYCPLVALGQQSLILRGEVADEAGKPVPFAIVAAPDELVGTTADAVGQFRMAIPPTDSILLRILCTGYAPRDTMLYLKGSGPLFCRVVLSFQPTEIEGVQVVAQRTPFPSVARIELDEAVHLPSSIGGVEALLKYLPGTSASNELTSQYSVRGGSFDENLVYIDGVMLHRPTLVRSANQEGLSVINPDMVANINFSAGAFPPSFGDRLSSVLDIQYRAPSANRVRLHASLLENRAYLEGHLPNQHLGAMLGVRYKNTALLLNTTQTKADYRPSFLDIQTKLTYSPIPSLELALLAGLSRNAYHFDPIKKTTEVASGLGSKLSLNVYYEGHERDLYISTFSALTAKWQPIDPLSVSLTLALYSTLEQEKFDILGEYWLSDLSTNDPDSPIQDSLTSVGIGGAFEHARNYYDALVYSAHLKTSYRFAKHETTMGLQASRRDLAHNLSEWSILDSAGYTLPIEQTPWRPLEAMHNSAALSIYHFALYAQAIFRFKIPAWTLSLVAGGRLTAKQQLHALRFSPRGSFSLTPDAVPALSLYLASGYYYQYPIYRDMRDHSGVLHPDLRPQRAIHALLGARYSFLILGHPFNLQAELYYKALKHIIPYKQVNLSLQYEAQNAAQGQVYGLDCKINGQLAEGIESWIALSLMNARMKIVEPLYAKELMPVSPGYFPAPTDQRFSASLLLEDYLPRFPAFRVHLAAHYATGLPLAHHKAPYGTQSRFPAYKRVDIGFAYVAKDAHYTAKWLKKATWLSDLAISIDVLNLLNFSNTASYMWVAVPLRTGAAGQLAVPNYLTTRCVNIRLNVGF